MWFWLAWILVASIFPGYIGAIKWITSEKAEIEWKRFAEQSSHGTVSRLFRSSPPADPQYAFLPPFLRTSLSEAQIPLFQPGVGVQPLPNSIRSLFFPATTVPPPEPAGEPVEALCHVDRIYVRVRADLFYGLNPFNFLNLGTCEVNYGTQEHFYFLYRLTTDCGFTFQDTVDEVIVTNDVHFQPTTRILRDMPFKVSVTCNYHKYFNSYKGAVRPKLLGRTLHKSLRRLYRPVELIPQDALGNEKTTAVKMGETMYFEAKLVDGVQFSANERMYINKCIVSSSMVLSDSDTEVEVIDQYGCMLDAKVSPHSKFISGPPKISQRFSLQAGILAEMADMEPGIKKLYLHCDISVKEDTATEGRKACNYNSETSSWFELYGTSSVCDCCDSTCAPMMFRAASRHKVTSRPWKIQA